MEIDTIFITEEEEGERLDRMLANRFQAVQSRTYFQNLINEGRVLLNGDPVKKRIKPKKGDEVEIHFIFTPEISIVPEPIPLSILYEDEAILVVNKPPGMVVHPALGNWSGTFVNALLHHCQLIEAPTSSFPRPGIVHRLDKDTSGVMVAAKQAKAGQRLMEHFSKREVHKEYLAICLGNPGSKTIDAPIGRHPVKRKEMAVLKEGGRPSVTHCTTLAFDGQLSQVRLVLETGRTHQIRVHLKHLGTPILGDAVYGNASVNQKLAVSRQLLHAELLRFPHPLTGQIQEFRAPWPDDIKQMVEKISKKGGQKLRP
jgi:23S rRNA pseudouridine1911/1915/1917 synthase